MMNLEQVVQSQLQMAQSIGSLSDALSASKTMQTSTRDVVATLTVPSAVTAITVAGTTTEGDGGAGLYVRVSADPGAVEKVQSADGSWFQLAQQSIGQPVAGWDVPTGTMSRATFNTATVTLPQLAQRVAQLIEDLRTQGIITS